MATASAAKNTSKMVVDKPKASTTNNKQPDQKQNKVINKFKTLAKIEKLPKDVRSSIPIESFMQNGIIETSPGIFTKCYRLNDINFSIAPDNEQEEIFQNFMAFLNSFDDSITWQFVIFCHEIDKKETINKIRILPQKDGLNKYRQEMNGILVDALKKGNNSITQEKYLVIAVKDESVEHVVAVFKNLDGEVSKRLRRICKEETRPLTTQERIVMLYNIYNQDNDYRLTTGIYNGKDDLDLRYLEKYGLSVKDIIGPPIFDFTPKDRFMIGDTYGSTLYLQHIPKFLSTNFIADISNIQSNMLISTYYEAEDSEKAVKMVKNQLANIESRIATLSKRNLGEGVIGSIPPDLENANQNARELLTDITSRNQNLFYVTVVVTVFARTLERLEENIKLVKSTAQKHICPMKILQGQQEFAFNSSLPLARNDVFVEGLYTTESAAVFIPFNSQELKQKNAIFYGLNSISKNMILYDRTTGNNYNGLIFGYSGSGKSFTAKMEMISVLLNHPDAQVFVIDPQGEYYPLAQALGGEEIYLSPGSRVYINPLDLDISNDSDGESDPITMKSDFIISMFGIIIGKGRELSPIHTSLIDKCVRKIYRSYIDELARTGMTCDVSKCPTLSDLYQELQSLKNERYEAGQLADILAQYAIGSFDTFAHRTNVKTNSRFVVYNTKNLGTGMKELGLHICMNDVWNRMIHNSVNHIYTWVYVDEFHLLLESDGTALFLKRIWKMARKWLGVPTGIMQNTEDLLRSADTRAIMNNTSFVIMLKEPLMDRQNLQALYNLSPTQLEYITNSDPGHGLLYNGKVVLPFGYDFPKKSKLYALLTTAHDDDGAQFA